MLIPLVKVQEEEEIGDDSICQVEGWSSKILELLFVFLKIKKYPQKFFCSHLHNIIEHLENQIETFSLESKVSFVNTVKESTLRPGFHI